MSITLALGAAMSGLQTSQQALDSVSRNIANVNTPGYSRKIFNQQSMILAGRGVGVENGELVRNVDESLLRDIRRASAVAENLSVQNNYYSRIQDTFGTPSDNTSIAHTLNDLAQSFEALGVDVTSLTQAMNTVQSAQDVADQLANMTETLQTLRVEADRGIEADVLAVNNALKRIDELNSEIVRNQNTFLDTGDLKDQRDQALTELSGLLDITYFTRDSGDVIVMTNTGRSLLDKNPATMSHMAATKTSSETSYDGGNFTGITVNGEDLTQDIKGGSISGYIEMRDKTLPAMQSQLDELATKMKEAINLAHNRGTSSPALAQEFTGTRKFISPGTQSITIPSGDVKLVLYTADGKEAASTSLSAAMGSGPPNITGTVQDVVDGLNSFYSSYAGSSVNWASLDADTGQLKIEIPSTEAVGFAMRDEDSTGAAADVTINFNSDGDGSNITDEQVSGFSNFFGLNDFYVNDSNNYLYDSDVVSSNWRASTTSQMQFGIEGNTNVSQVDIGPQDTLATIAAKINADAALTAENISASVIKEGSGVRLRILQNDGKEMVVSETTTQGVLSRIGVKPSQAGNAENMTVRDDLKTNSAKLSRGLLQYNSDTGKYSLATSDNTVANQMAAVFSNATAFDEAGGISSGSMTIAEYGSTILSQNATEASRAKTQSQTQTTLTESLNLKQGEVSGVNLDEELSQLLIYQQAYTASAKVISATQELFDVLNNMIR